MAQVTYKIPEKGNCRRSFLVFFYNAGEVRSILATVALILQCTFTIWLRGKQKEEKIVVGLQPT